jgi:hypothetical protein
MRIRWIKRASWLAPYFAVALLLGGSSAAASVATTTTTTNTTTTTAGAIKVNPLSQHASHCAGYPYLDCLVTLKNQKTVGVSWSMETQRESSDNTNDNSWLYVGSQGSEYIVSGYLNPGQTVTVEIVTLNCYYGYGQYWTWIVGSSSGSTTYAPQATILNCF